MSAELLPVPETNGHEIADPNHEITSKMNETELRAYRVAERIYWSSPADTKHYHFHLRKDGVFLIDTRANPQPTLWVCGWLKVVALTRDEHSNSWGKLLHFKDYDNKLHELVISNALLVGEGDELARTLATAGLKMPPGRTAVKLQIKYLLETNPQTRAQTVTRTGWSGSNFTLPDCTFGPNSERIIFNSGNLEARTEAACGSLEEWKSEIGKLCSGNSRLVFAVSTAFAAPLLRLIDQESGGFHFSGSSSSGKTTTLRVAASVWGGKEYVKTWRSTANGMEGTAVAHCDCLLCLDELAQVDPKEAGEIAYLLANEGGKTRAMKTGDARPTKHWRLLFISTGEITLADHVKQAGKKLKGGQDVRMLDIPPPHAEMGIFENIHAFPTPAAFASHLSSATARSFGTPIRQFLPELFARDVEKIKDATRKTQKLFLEKFTTPEMAGQVTRAANRFSTCAAAGNLATALGITGWAEDEAFEAAGKCFNAWMLARGSSGDFEENSLVCQVKSFIESHGESRFALLASDSVRVDSRAVVNKAGYRRQGPSGTAEWLVTTEAFRREVVTGFNFNWATKVLIQRKILVPGSGGKSSQCIYIPELNDTIRVYCIKSNVLGGDE